MTAGKEAFVSVSLAANSIAAAPVPGSLLLLLSSPGIVGGLVLYSRRTRPMRPPALTPAAAGPGR